MTVVIIAKLLERLADVGPQQHPFFPGYFHAVSFFQLQSFVRLVRLNFFGADFRIGWMSSPLTREGRSMVRARIVCDTFS